MVFLRGNKNINGKGFNKVDYNNKDNNDEKGISVLDNEGRTMKRKMTRMTTTAWATTMTRVSQL